MKPFALLLVSLLCALPLAAQCGDAKATAKGCEAGCSTSCTGPMNAQRAGEIVDNVRKPGCANIARHGLKSDLGGFADNDEAQHFVARLREAPDRDAAIALVMKRVAPKDDDFNAAAAKALAQRVRAPGCSSGGRNFIFQEMDAIQDIDVAAKLAAKVREAQDLDQAADFLLTAARTAPAHPVSLQDQDEAPTSKKRPFGPEAALDMAKRVREPGCSSGGSNLLFQELDAITEIEEAEILAARVREARDLRAAAAEILFAGLQRAQPKLPKELPATLVDTGFFADLEARTMAAGFVPYDVNVPLWSDGAKKARFFRLPEGTQAEFTRDGEWRFPDGTTFLQTLYFPKTEEDDELRVETRVMVKRGKDPLFGVYVWNDDADDGELTENGDEFFANHGNQSQLWKVARTKDCTKCHNEAAGLILGLNTAQLNRALAKDPKKNQLRELASAGHVAKMPESLDDLPALPNPHDASQPLEARARAYLHVHCATCHQPGGPGSGTMDLRTQTEFLATGIVRSPTHRVRRGQIRPGRPGRSRLIGRMASVDWDRMPDLLTTVPDDKAIAMLSEWVRSMKPTPPRRRAPRKPLPATGTSSR